MSTYSVSQRVAMQNTKSYRMLRHEVICPQVTNDGDPSGYPLAFAKALLASGIDGWTETNTMGYWKGKAEPGTTFMILSERDIVPLLGKLARACMPDQEAIQVSRVGWQDIYEA